jgi:hypothetical protein
MKIPAEAGQSHKVAIKQGTRLPYAARRVPSNLFRCDATTSRGRERRNGIGASRFSGGMKFTERTGGARIAKTNPMELRSLAPLFK